MKKYFVLMLMFGFAGIAMAQMTPEEKAAQKAAEKEAKAKVSEGMKLRDEISTLYQTIQTENAKGDKANSKVVETSEQSIHSKALEANTVLSEALNSGNVPQKSLFDCGKALDDVSQHLFNAELMKASKQTPFDTLLYTKTLDDMCNGCYTVMTYGNKKDMIQEPTIKVTSLKMPKLKIYYGYLCSFYCQAQDLEGAITSYEKYYGFGEKYPLVANEEEVKNPSIPYSQFAFNIYLISYNQKKYDISEKYYDMAYTYPDESSHAFVVGSRAQMYKEQGDTVKWVAALKDLIQQNPNSTAGDVAAQNLLSIYSKESPAAMRSFAEEILAANPESKIGYYGLGYSYFEEEKYEEAYAHFQKSVEMDPNYVHGFFMAGSARYRQAMNNYYQYIDQKKYKTQAEVNAAEEKYVKQYFREAMPYFEQVMSMDESQTEVCAGILLNIYKNLGMKEKADSMKALLQ